MSKYTPEFRADAVALYRASPGCTYASVAKDLGINHGTLRVWVRGTERAVVPGTALARENEQLKARVRELELEREILHRAARYFSGETNW
ncbi:transposase (plasmid) [Kitasatospora sp. NBC_00070]